MKITEFVLTETKGSSTFDLVYFAEVLVSTGFLWWKRAERRKIAREFGGYWYFVDTGEFTPGFQVETLARAYKAQLNLRRLKL
jgi:hypothetical protein